MLYSRVSDIRIIKGDSGNTVLIIGLPAYEEVHIILRVSNGRPVGIIMERFLQIGMIGKLHDIHFADIGFCIRCAGTVNKIPRFCCVIQHLVLGIYPHHDLVIFHQRRSDVKLHGDIIHVMLYIGHIR